MSYPRGLYEETIALGWTVALKAALEATGATEPRVELASYSQTNAEYRATWTT